MVLKEKYNVYKAIYKEYIILIKSGNFYLSLNDDAIIMNRIFNYKVKETTNLVRVGFPITILNKVEQELDKRHINYILIDNEDVQKYKYKNNMYSKYSLQLDNYNILMNRVNKIYEILKNSLDNSNIRVTLNEIEEVLCKISC